MRCALTHVVAALLQVPDARRAVEDGQLCRRKSLAEVDLNRNWGVAWRSGAPRGGDEFGGAQPFSEPHSRALRDLAREAPPVAYANVHSGEWALYVPWDHKKARHTPIRRAAHGVLTAMQALAQGMPADTEELLETLNTHCKARAEWRPDSCMSDATLSLCSARAALAARPATTWHSAPAWTGCGKARRIIAAECAHGD